jgi:23S rRNA (guanosine2251-2'-O)-methyltransferase
MRAVLLHNIRSAHNVGSIFRTADAAGIDKIYLSGYTPRPIDRFGRIQKDIAKTALGAESSVQWVSSTPKKACADMRALKGDVVGVELDFRAIDYRSYVPKESVLYIVGSEVLGMSPALRTQCDVLLEIPMRGTKESLNVGVAAGIVLFAGLPQG